MRISSFVMWSLAVAIIGLAACGKDDDGGTNPDAPQQVDAPPADSPPAAELTCANYCSRITANCTTANMQPQYGSMAECMTSCTRYPLGTAADMGGNTLGCRIYHASAAMTGPAVHCRHAGPGGDGACGANCLGFCTLVLGSCIGANEQYGGDMNTCMTACGNFATTPAYTSDVRSGDSFACRLYHATAASMTPAVHCPHTAVNSATCQ